MENNFIHVFVTDNISESGSIELFDLRKATTNMALSLFIESTIKSKRCNFELEVSSDENPSKYWDVVSKSFKKKEK